MAAKKRKRVGLALSGGAARGMAHIGVLEVLERENVPVDMIAGTSIGAIIGAMYAKGKTIAEIKEAASDLGWRKQVRLIDITLPKTGFLSGRKIKALLRETIGEVDFADLRIPFACVATDIMNGEEVVFRQGPVLEAVIASSSLPIIFKVAKLGGRYLVDGGVVNPVPVSVLKDMGADFIIAVNILFQHSDSARDGSGGEAMPGERKETKEPNIINIMMRLINIAANQVVKSSLSGADVVIRPEVTDTGFSEFGSSGRSILQGELAAQDAIIEIKRRLAD